MAYALLAQRDYSLVGSESKSSVESGLAEAEWYKSPIPREKMRELLVRKDFPAVRDTILWFGLIAGSGYLVWLWWGSWFVIFPYIIYSVLYASTSDSRWHEAGHGTAFRTEWMNDVLYEIASFMVFRQSTVWRWSHTRHHSDTIIRGRDPEIAVPRPPSLRKIFLGFIGISGARGEIRRILLHSTGRIDKEVETYLPENEYSKVILRARIYLAIYFAVILLALYFRSFLPLMYIGLPTLLGSWLMPVYGLTQHAGLQENVLDHRLNCRTVYMNRVHRFLYWNMNYHIEHHMFPLVPYHALPRLHALMKEDCPKPYKGILEAYREIIPAILRQRKDVTYFVERLLPERIISDPSKGVRRIDGDPGLLSGGRIVVCRADDLLPGEVVRFDLNHKTYAVYRTVTDGFYATDGFCTHGNAHLAEGLVIGDLIECAKHNGRFRLRDGMPHRMPVCDRTRTYRVEIVSGNVMIDLSDNQQAAKLNEDEERSYSVVSNRNLTPFIRELVVKPLENKPFSFLAGQYVKILIPPFRLNFKDLEIDERFRKIWGESGLFDLSAENELFSERNYSLANDPSNGSGLVFNVRIALPPPGVSAGPGSGSSYIFNLRPGDEVKLKGPFGSFLIRQSEREMIYVGGGAGMAPIRSHLAHLFETVKTSRKVSYWYGARTEADLFYMDYFRDLQKKNMDFSFHVSLSDTQPEDKWSGYSGFIHTCLYDNYLAFHPEPCKCEYYLCGPPAMIEATLDMLHKLGVGKEMISYDEF
jgi:Na+-transporting NADH:ubiquinone oxidoreductase subunit F